MEWTPCLLHVLVSCLMAAFVCSQSFTQDELLVVQQAFAVALRLNNTQNRNDQDVSDVATTILTNPVINDLIQRFGVVDTQTVQGSSLLISAASGGFLPVVQAVLSTGSYIDLRDENGWTALIWASSKNHTEVAVFLINAGADGNIRNSDYGDTAFSWAAANGNLEIAKNLLRGGYDVKIADIDGDTPLIIAASKGFLEIVNLLIEAGADVNAQDKNGWSSLYLATQINHLEIVRALLRAKADPDVKTAYYGETPLMMAISSGFDDIVRELIVAGADFNLASNQGLTPLTNAARNKQPQEARLLLSAGADIDRQAEDGDTALMDAVNLGLVDVVKVFLEHCPNLGLVNRNRKTVYDIASSRRIPEISNMLTSHPNFICYHNGAVYNVGNTRFDVCREVRCCQGIWSPTGRTLDTCGAQCRKILAPAGVCTNIFKCPQLMQQLSEKVSNSPNRQQSGNAFVESYGCGLNDERNVQVCCPTA